MKTYTSKVLEIMENGDAIIELPQEMLDELEWKEGDVLDFNEMYDGLGYHVIIKNITKEEKDNASST